VCGFSVPASEHSVACSFGDQAEMEYFHNMLQTYKTGIVSIVSDTYNVYKFVQTMSTEYRDLILSRDGVTVFRPDSGDPVEVNSKLIDMLWEIFGGTYTEDGYKVLVPQVRLIQGDGIDRDMLNQIMKMLIAKRFSVDNIVFGSGGGLLQKFDRDTCKFAIKASYGTRMVNGKLQKFEIKKDPITSKGKASKGGMLKLHRAGYGFMTMSSTDNCPMFASYADSLEVVYENGEIKMEQSFDEVRKESEYWMDIELEKEKKHAEQTNS
ncbi:MAG: hypothetical protein R3182_04615, partial [Draconibacterium sp.]|nr:hypothetical protein [Draconibacterium sp.]